jgi:hypothetical protein
MPVMLVRHRRVLAVVMGGVVAVAVAGCGAESPDGAAPPRGGGSSTPAVSSAMGVTERSGEIDFIDAHLAAVSGRRTVVQMTLANTDPDRRHDLAKVTARGTRARITGPGSGGAPGRLPLPPATHVDTLAGRYTLTFPAGTLPRHGTVRVAFAFTGEPGITVALPVLRR